MAAMNMEANGNIKLVGKGQGASVSPVQGAFYTILVILGILGNATVVGVIGNSAIMDRGGGRNSDIIIINLALSNLLLTLWRNTLLIFSDLGVLVRGLQDQQFVVCCQ